MTTTETKVTAFEAGNIYQMNFIGDSDLKPHWICVKRTDKMATFERLKHKETITRKIQIWGGVEHIHYGSYSMAPSIYADKVVG